jgi:hypothetical protein
MPQQTTQPLDGPKQQASAGGAGVSSTPATSENETFRPSVALLPETTEGFLEFTDLPALAENWQKTSLSKIQHDDAMRPFFDSEREKIEKRLANMGMKIGVTLRDFCDAVSGDVVLAWLSFETPQRPYSIVLMADTRGRDQQREDLLAKIDAELKSQEAKVSTTQIDGLEAVVYTLPKKKGQITTDRFALLSLEGRLIISDHVETLTELVKTANSGSPGGLEKQAEFKKVFESLGETHQAGEQLATDTPKLRWFARPIQMGMIARQIFGVDRGRQVDILNLLREQGFDAIRAAGGEFHLATDSFDLLHRGFVLAPPTTEKPDRYRLAARSLQFPNAEFGPTPAWVVPSAASLLRANWKMQDAFWSMETLVDAAFSDKGFFREMLEGIRKDPSGGIQVDVANDLVANLGQDFLIMTENEVVDGETHEQVLGALRITDATTVAKVVNDALSKDPDIFKVPFADHPVWEVRPSASAEPDDFIDDLGFEFNERELANAKPAEPLLDAWSFTVFDGYLMFSSHADFLIKVIKHANQQGGTLEDTEAFKRAHQAIAAETAGKPLAMTRVVRTELAWRIKYQLIREGKFVESDSLLANLIRRAQESSEKAEAKNADAGLEIDTSLLPEFEAIRQYLQPAGGYMQTTDQGWTFTQFLLR